MESVRLKQVLKRSGKFETEHRYWLFKIGQLIFTFLKNYEPKEALIHDFWMQLMKWINETFSNECFNESKNISGISWLEESLVWILLWQGLYTLYNKMMLRGLLS